MSKQSYFKQFSLAQFTSTWTIDRTLSGTNTPRLSGHGSDGNEGVLRIPQSLSITGTSPSDCFESYPGHGFRVFTLLQRFSQYILQPWLTGKEKLTRSNIIMNDGKVIRLVCALRTVSSSPKKGLDELEISGRIEITQITTLLRSVRRVFETWRDFVTLRFQWMPTS